MEYFISLANCLVFSVETNKNLDKIKIHALYGKRHLSRLCLNVLKPNSIKASRCVKSVVGYFVSIKGNNGTESES